MRCKYFLLFLFFITVVSLNRVDAVGIGYNHILGGPIDFEPQMERTFNYFIITNAGIPMDYEINLSGDLKPYVTLSTNLIKNVPSGANIPFSATLKLPSALESGLHDAIICVLETQTRGGGMIGARTQACSGFIIRVLYGEKYLRIENFNVPNVDMGDKLKMELTVKSWSEVDINSIKAVIDISGPSREKGVMQKIATVETEEKPLKSNAEETLTAYFGTAGLEAGEYIAFATLYYDGKQLNDSHGFRVGTLTIKILNYTKEFEQGKVNKLEVQVLSEWNSKIDGIYSTVDIGEERLMTPLINLEPWENKTLLTYWDTTNKKTGDYKGKIVVYYSNKTTEEEGEFKVILGKEKIRGIIINIAIAIVIAILIITLIILFLKTRKQETGESTVAIKRRQKK